MKRIFSIILLSITLTASAQENGTLPNSYWQIGFGLGELPTGGSFKPSITIGYHFNEKLYGGIIYQFSDHIQRDQASINAKSSGLEGLLTASESVGQRFLIQCRYTPFKNGPYLSSGFVFNDRDTEVMLFDDRSRMIGSNTYDGEVSISQTRPAGWGFALGIGYQYTFKNGFGFNAEWTPAWIQGYPKPEYEIEGQAEINDADKISLESKMDEEFKSSVTNLYKVFHIGISYSIK